MTPTNYIKDKRSDREKIERLGKLGVKVSIIEENFQIKKSNNIMGKVIDMYPGLQIK